jgi:hypothetical protein
MSIIRLCEDGYPDWLTENGGFIESFKTTFGCDIDASEEELWQRGRQCDDSPHFGNLFIEMVFDRAEFFLLENYGVECKVFINDIVSEFNIANDVPDSLKNIKEWTEEIKEILEED